MNAVGGLCVAVPLLASALVLGLRRNAAARDTITVSTMATVTAMAAAGVGSTVTLALGGKGQACHSNGLMLTDHNIVLTVVVAGFSIVVDQLPKAVFTLILNLPCCDLK